MILEEGPMPLYYQIKNIIKSKILSNEFKEQECLPSEGELCKRYEVSRGTLRQALSELIKEGLIYRARGRGTFVADGAGLRRLTFKGTIENLITSSRDGRISVIDYKEVTPPSHITKTLLLESAENVFQLELLFSIPKGPSRYSLIYFPSALGKIILREQLKETTEIILVVEEKLQTRIHHVHQTINIRLADRLIAKYLSIEEGIPIFVMERHYIGRNGSPLFMSINYCRPDLYKFRIELTRT